MPMFGITPTLAAAGAIKGPLAKGLTIGGLVTNPAQTLVGQVVGKTAGAAARGDEQGFQQGMGAMGAAAGTAMLPGIGGAIGGQVGNTVGAAGGSLMNDPEQPPPQGGIFTNGPFNRQRRFG